MSPTAQGVPTSGKPVYTATIADLSDSASLAAWNVLRREAELPVPFGSPLFLRAAGDAFRREIGIGLVYDAEGPRLGVPLYLDRRFGIARAGMPPFVAYTPVYRRGGWSEAETHAGSGPLTHLARSLRTRFGAVALHLQPGWADVRPFLWNGWTARPLYTYVAPIAAPSDPLRDWSKNNRRDARAYRDEFSVSESSAQVDSVVRLIDASYERHGRKSPRAGADLAGLIRELTRQGLARVFLAVDTQDAPSAGAVLLVEADRAYYWLAGSLPGHAMTVLMATLFESLAAAGVRAVDFVGANTPSIAEFKRRFGSVLTPYHRLQFVRGGAAGLIHAVRPLV